MSKSETTSSPEPPGPSQLDRADRHEVRMLVGVVGAAAFAAAWFVLLRAVEDAPSVPTTFAIFSASVMVFHPAVPDDRKPDGQLRAVSAVVAYAITWVLMTSLGFGRLHP